MSILSLESFAERHEHWLHAIWVVTWAIIITFLSLLFVFSSITEHDQIRKIFLQSSTLWVAGIFILQLLILSSMLPLIHWMIPRLAQWIMGKTLFNLEPLLYFLLAFTFLPLFVVALFGIPIVLAFFVGAEFGTTNFAVYKIGYSGFFYLFPITVIFSLLFLFWKGGTILRDGSGIDTKTSYFLFTLLILMHFIGTFINILFMMVIFQFIELLL